MTLTVPSLSLLDYTEGSPRTRIHFLMELEDALHEIGFVRFRDHGIPPQLLQEFYELLRVFFVDWSEEKRMELEQRDNGYRRGYGPLGCERTKGTNELSGFDKKCFLSTGVALSPDHPHFKEIPVNIYPDIPNFRRINDEVYRTIMRAAQIIFRAVSEILNMGPDWLPRICANGDCMQRGLYYPGTKSLPNLARVRAAVLNRQWRSEQTDITPKLSALLSTLKKGEAPKGSLHSRKCTDIGVGVILPRANATGLVAISRSGDKVKITGDESEVLYQNGDTIEDLSGGYLRSAEHYVGEHGDPEADRIGSACFLRANGDTWIDIVEPMHRHASKSVTPATELRKFIMRLHEMGHTTIPMPNR